VIALQNKWKTIGFAPQKMNVRIFERFRKACDEFFSKKGEFFKGIKEGMNENLKKKEALCEKAEALKESTDWKETSDALIKLQKEWKTIGSVSRKHSDIVWKRFITACDYFFEQKGKVTSSLHSEEAENLVLKKAIINRLANMDESASDKEAEEEVRKLIKEWGTIGHVPFREKDKLYEEFNGLIDKHYERLHISISDKKLYNFKSSLSNLQETSQSLYKEREKLVRTHDRIKNDIQVYENNLGFFTSSSKKGENLLVEANRKIEKLKDDLDLVSQKIKVINEELKKES
jgi:chromosome segregation ATPase